MNYKVKTQNENTVRLNQSRLTTIMPASLAAAGSVFLGIAFPELIESYENRTALLLSGLGLIGIAIGLSIIVIIRYQPFTYEFFRKDKVLNVYYRKNKPVSIPFQRISHCSLRTETSTRIFIEVVFTGGFRLILMQLRSSKRAVKLLNSLNEILQADPDNPKYLSNKEKNLKPSHIQSNINIQDRSQHLYFSYVYLSAILSILGLCGIALTAFIGLERVIPTVYSLGIISTGSLILFSLLLYDTFFKAGPVKITLGQDSVCINRRKKSLYEIRTVNLEITGLLYQQSVLPEIQFISDSDREELNRILNLPASLKRSNSLRRFYSSLPKILMPGYKLIQALNIYHWLFLNIKN